MPWFFVYALLFVLPLAGIYYYNNKTILEAGEVLWKWKRAAVRRWLLLFSCFVNLLPLAALVTFWIGGREAAQAFSGENRLVDYFLVYPFWFSLVISAQLFLLLLVWRVVRIFFHKSDGSRSLLRARITLGIVAFALVYSCLTIVINTWTIRLHERDVKLPEAFAGLAGTRIAQIADVQGDGRTTPELIGRLVAKANALQPDIVFFCGDVVTSGPKYVASTIKVLSGLQSRYGKFAAVGDHDMFSGKQPILEGLRGAGFDVPEDSSVRLAINGVPVVITGVVYTYRQRPNANELTNATDNGNPTERDYKIFLVHQPREELVRYADGKGYHLFVAGHTHGGAIAFGIPGIFLVAPSRFETKYFSGFYEIGKMLVSVNNGLGHTLAPIRFQAPVEVTLIRLVK